MAANTNSTNHNGIPTITIVESAEQSRNDKLARRSCCGCIPEIVGVFAILSMYFVIQECKSEAQQANLSDIVDCNGRVNANLTSEAIKLVIHGAVSIYFAYVIFRFARTLNKEVLPFTASPADGQKTPTYFVYANQPPTSNSWVPPPTYTVRPTNLPDDFNPDSKQIPH
ncbi:hypothetical protein C1645_769558 [Glomus cerebriforme]|uniref:Uncharacterized protein n=1 Tax=Glomus cerebriforme TaxID=658196 RepID=A0A397SY81_9GLOM|nr:hypothetical protein C1645_769558 [Glomus cerebriforme]